MKLYNVRKGQFVYYENELYKVYSVKPFFKKSVHLIRMRDLEQNLAEAREVELYRVQNLDSFIYNHNRYTLHKEKRAQKGDYILIINPKPDAIDHYSFHAIEVVSTSNDYGVVSNKANGIKHNEYWLMMHGREEANRAIDLQNAGDEDSFINDEQQEEFVLPDVDIPAVGDVFTKNDAQDPMKVMVVALKPDTVILGGGMEISRKELDDTDKWNFAYHLLDQ